MESPIADYAVNLAGRGYYPVTRGTIPDDAACALQAQPDGEQPVHDITRELRHRVLRAARLRLSRQILPGSVGHEHHPQIELYTCWEYGIRDTPPGLDAGPCPD
jgi:hypothetical protein